MGMDAHNRHGLVYFQCECVLLTVRETRAKPVQLRRQ